MRQPKNKPLTFENIDTEFARMNDDAGRKTMLMVLNQRNHTHVMTGTPLTPETQKRMTDLVIAVKQTTDGLALLDPPQKLSEISSRFKDQVKEINRAFSHVRLVPGVGVSGDGRNLNVSENIYVDPKINFSTIHEHNYLINGTELNMLEQLAVLSLVSLMRTGMLNYLRRCDCGEWYIANRLDQKFHSPACRQRKHASTPEFRKTRRVRYATKKKLAENKVKAEAKRAKKTK